MEKCKIFLVRGIKNVGWARCETLCPPYIFFLHGFTLIESLIVLIIISFALVMAVPNFKTVSSRAEDQLLSAQLLRAIQITQQQALLRHETLTLKKLPGGWLDGYEIRTHDKILQRFLNNKIHGELHWRAFPKHQEDLKFLSSGLTPAENGTFWFCRNKKAKPEWAIVLNQAGRARLVLPDEAKNLLC